jgi:hypothetical protein
VTLSGINRAHWLQIQRIDGTGSISDVAAFPLGNTGTTRLRFLASGNTNTEFSLDAPSAGTNQVLTINGTDRQLQRKRASRIALSFQARRRSGR